MKISILQSNYIPWPGYFQLILNADLVCIYDDVQYTKNDWRNRNLIMGADGPKWLTVPVHGSTLQNIDTIRIAQPTRWQKKHFLSLIHCYSSYPEFKILRGFLEKFYECKDWTFLSELNFEIIQYLTNEIFRQKIEFVSSKSVATQLSSGNRLFALIRHFNADTYLSGPAVFNYCRGEDFENKGINLQIARYDGNEFGRMFNGQNYSLSVLDLICRYGYDSKMRLVGEDKFISWKKFNQSKVSK